MAKRLLAAATLTIAAALGLWLLTRSDDGELRKAVPLSGNHEASRRPGVAALT